MAGYLYGNVVTLQVAVLPFTLVAVIVQAPGVFPALTSPFALTVAMALLSDVHVTVLKSVVVGVTVAKSCSVLPFAKLALVLFSLIPVS